MKKLYFVQIEDTIQGMFDESHDLVTAWSPNDANWRGEYMGEMMEWAGVEVVDDLWHEDPDLYKELQGKLAKEYDIDEQDWG